VRYCSCGLIAWAADNCKGLLLPIAIRKAGAYTPIIELPKQETDMKRNHTNHRVPRNGTSPYQRYSKQPCKHCQDITAESRRLAHGDNRTVAKRA
jgi:hypothetical protein